MDEVKYGLGPIGGAILFLVFFTLLGGAFFVESQSFITYDEMPALFWFASFYRVGALIFGGGQVRSLESHLRS